MSIAGVTGFSLYHARRSAQRNGLLARFPVIGGVTSAILEKAYEYREAGNGAAYAQHREDANAFRVEQAAFGSQERQMNLEKAKEQLVFGNEALANLDYNSADRFFCAALKFDPKNVEARAGLRRMYQAKGEIYLRNGDYLNALRSFQRAGSKAGVDQVWARIQEEESRVDALLIDSNTITDVRKEYERLQRVYSSCFRVEDPPVIAAKTRLREKVEAMKHREAIALVEEANQKLDAAMKLLRLPTVERLLIFREIDRLFDQAAVLSPRIVLENQREIDTVRLEIRTLLKKQIEATLLGLSLIREADLEAIVNACSSWCDQDREGGIQRALIEGIQNDAQTRLRMLNGLKESMWVGHIEKIVGRDLREAFSSADFERLSQEGRVIAQIGFQSDWLRLREEGSSKMDESIDAYLRLIIRRPTLQCGCFSTRFRLYSHKLLDEQRVRDWLTEAKKMGEIVDIETRLEPSQDSIVSL